MDIQGYWEKALKKTEIVRPRVQPLSAVSSTLLPYIFLGESSVNAGDTVVRKGEVLVERPAIFLPSNHPQFEGFDPDEKQAWDAEGAMNFLLVRGVRFPSLKYNNKTHALDLFEGRLPEAVKNYLKDLQQAENISTGLVIGPEDCWQFSVLIFIAGQMTRQADGDFRHLWDDFGRRFDRS